MGGVFIATLVGLGIAMIVLAFEVYFHKKDQKNAVQDIRGTGSGGNRWVSRKSWGDKNFSSIISPINQIESSDVAMSQMKATPIPHYKW